MYDCVKYKNIISDNDILTKLTLMPQSVKIVSGDAVWFKVVSIKDVFKLLSVIPINENVMFVAGNTAQGKKFFTGFLN